MGWPFRDLREFLNELENRGTLRRIKVKVDWDQEIGAIAQEAAARGEGALLFENIKDHNDTPCTKLVIDTLGSWQRLMIALGMPEDSHPLNVVKKWKERAKELMKSHLVDEGPCKEVIKKDSDVNLFEFPAPKLHGKDGGRYITTWAVTITRDPDTRWINAGIYRGMIKDKNQIGMLYTPPQHWSKHGRKYMAMGKPMPMAIIIGIDPITMMVAGSPVPAGVNEYDVIGGIRRKPLEVIRCETLDLEVPANAEIVLEGAICLDPKTFELEGPYGEYPGYYTTLWAEPRPVFEVKCVTHRKDPVFGSVSTGLGPDLTAGGSCFMAAVGYSAAIWEHLERAGVEGVTGVWCDPDVVSTNIFVSIDKLYYGHARQVAAAIWGTSLSSRVGKFVVVTDSDVDITNLKKVNAAIANRTQGAKDIVIYPGTFGGPLDPGNSPEVKEMTGGIGNWDRVLIDATWPFEWKPRQEWGGLRHPPSCLAEPEVVERIRKKWKDYGLE